MGLHVAENKKNEDPDFPFMCVCMAIIHSMAFIPTINNRVMLDKITEKIDDILSDYFLASIHIGGDFNIYHKKWVVHSLLTDEEAKYCHDFSVAYDHTQIVDKPTRVPDTTGYHAKLLDFFLNLVMKNAPLKC